MNTTFFGCKRAHHSCLRVSRALLGDEITPARFDLLFVLLASDPLRQGTLQGTLTAYLGVSASVVSRMVTSLAKLGLVYRELDEDDGRRRYVCLSPAGRALIERLVAHIFGSGIDTLLVDSALGAERPWDRAHGSREASALRHTHRRLQYFFRDRARFDFDAPTSYKDWRPIWIAA